MTNNQLGLYDAKSPTCLFAGYVEDDDHHCNDLGMGPVGYSVIAEDSPDIDRWLAEVRGVDIQDVSAKDIPIPALPDYIPTITKGSAKLFTKFSPSIVAVKLGDVVSMEELRVADSLVGRFGIPPGTQVLLQGYGKDRLLENIWPKRHEVFSKLASLGFCAVTGLNYSVWRSQPHAERLINIKRAHLTYQELQHLGVPAVPHMYWCGQINLEAWLRWLDNNPAVKVMAIDMQTMRSDDDWERALAELRYFVSRLGRPIHFLITGPYTPLRVAQIKQLLPSMTLTNGSPARKAFASHKMDADGFRVKSSYSKMDKSLIFQHNTRLYQKMLQPKKTNFKEQFLANSQKGQGPRRQFLTARG